MRIKRVDFVATLTDSVDLSRMAGAPAGRQLRSTGGADGEKIVPTPTASAR